MVFQYSTNPAHHCQLLECLMTLKQNVLTDVLNVIAYGTSTARSSAARLLFYYWPPFNPTLFDKKGIVEKLSGRHIVIETNRRCVIMKTTSLKVILHHSCAKGIRALMPVTLKQPKYATIIAYRSIMPAIHRPLCIFVSNAQTKYTENTLIRCSSIYCIQCSKCR